MRKVVYCLNVSLDGFVEDSNGSLDWSNPDEELHYLAEHTQDSVLKDSPAGWGERKAGER